MILMDALKGLDKEQRIKVGATGGSGYFYCGTVEDFTENIASYNDTLNAYAKARVQRAESELAKHIAAYPTIAKWAAKAVESADSDLTLKSYEAYLEFWIRNLKRKRTTLIERKVSLDTYTALPFRKTDYDDADPSADPDVKRVMVSGDELGMFWTTDEADGNQIGLQSTGEADED